MENTREITDLEKLKIEAFDLFLIRENALQVLEKCNAKLNEIQNKINILKNETSNI